MSRRHKRSLRSFEGYPSEVVLSPTVPRPIQSPEDVLRGVGVELLNQRLSILLGNGKVAASVVMSNYKELRKLAASPRTEV